MSQLWSAFVANVQARCTAGAQSTNREDAAIQAVAEFAKSQIVREVEADLPRRQSYLNSYKALKVELAGYTMTSNFATTLAAVKTRITTDGVRLGIAESGGYLDKMVQHAMNDINGVATLFNAHLVDAAIEIQRKAVCYRGPFEVTFDLDDSSVSNVGLATQIELPASFELGAVRYGTRYTALAGNTAYSAGDVRESNGRVYECVTAGTSANPIGDGLTSTDGENETTGTAVFKYTGPTDYADVSPVSWAARYPLMQSECRGTSVYAISPQGDKMLVHPALDDEHDVRVEYTGFKTSFSSGDTVPFDQQCEAAAAHYVKAMLLMQVAENSRDAGVSMQLWQAALRRIYLDCQARKTGRP